MNFKKLCAQCGNSFESTGPAGMYCSKQCGQRYRYAHNMRTTEYQYSLASGNWKKYYTRRRSEKNRSAGLTVEQLLSLHDRQGGLCALTGVPMTCTLVRGQPCFTNASLDRIEPGGAYTIDNIRLVCVGINRFRGHLPVDDYIEWCRKVVNFHDKEKTDDKSSK
jgi:hypothetical protein